MASYLNFSLRTSFDTDTVVRIGSFVKKKHCNHELLEFHEFKNRKIFTTKAQKHKKEIECNQGKRAKWEKESNKERKKSYLFCCFCLEDLVNPLNRLNPITEKVFELIEFLCASAALCEKWKKRTNCISTKEKGCTLRSSGVRLSESRMKAESKDIYLFGDMEMKKLNIED